MRQHSNHYATFSSSSFHSPFSGNQVKGSVTFMGFTSHHHHYQGTSTLNNHCSIFAQLQILILQQQHHHPTSQQLKLIKILRELFRISYQLQFTHSSVVFPKGLVLVHFLELYKEKFDCECGGLGLNPSSPTITLFVIDRRQ